MPEAQSLGSVGECGLSLLVLQLDHWRQDFKAYYGSAKNQHYWITEVLGFSSLVWPFSKFGMGIEKKKIVLACLSPELSVTIKSLSR